MIMVEMDPILLPFVPIRGYKGAVKAFATTYKIEFDWQKRFYDHIIRDEKEFEFIRDYIRSNPKNW